MVEVFRMVRTRKALGIAAVLALVVIVLFAGCAFAGARLDRVMETKVLRVGTPGDYRPFAMLDKATGKYEGTTSTSSNCSRRTSA